MTLPNHSISQRHKMTWVFWITLPILTASMLLALFLGKDSEDFKGEFNLSDWMNSETLPAFVISFLVLLLLYNIELYWKYDNTGFYYRYRPFINRLRFIPKSEILSITCEKINPLRDFGGWGVRYSRKYGKAYSTHGNYVIRVNLKNGKMLNFTADPKLEL